jgi:hypothetical protein
MRRERRRQQICGRKKEMNMERRGRGEKKNTKTKLKYVRICTFRPIAIRDVM